MKRLLSLFCAAAALVAGLWSCQSGKEQAPMKWVDLRFSAQDSYELAAISPEAFSIVVTSTDPWTVTSANPVWCIIDKEEGEASDPEMVHIGKGKQTTVHVQYYDNNQLDDRTDYIEITSDYWLGKRITVFQHGTAYLTSPEAAEPQLVSKHAGSFTIHVEANQDWSASVTEGQEWMSISAGNTGTLDGEVVLSILENPGEIRYGAVSLKDRKGVEQVIVDITQDGVKLVAEAEQLRVGFEGGETSMKIESNAKWKVTRDNEDDTWFTIGTTSGEGDGTLTLTLEKNTFSFLRMADIVIETVPDETDGYVARRIVTLKQAYEVLPVRNAMNNAEYLGWRDTDNGYDGTVEVVENGLKFNAPARIKHSMPFGTYTFCWSGLTEATRIKTWFTLGDHQEIKYDLKCSEKRTSFEFNNDDSAGKPTGLKNKEMESLEGAHTMTVKLDPAGVGYCSVTFLLDGEFVASFDSSEKVMNALTWGADFTIYWGAAEGGNPVCEWYEYTAPVDWGD